MGGQLHVWQSWHTLQTNSELVLVWKLRVSVLHYANDTNPSPAVCIMEATGVGCQCKVIWCCAVLCRYTSWARPLLSRQYPVTGCGQSRAAVQWVWPIRQQILVTKEVRPDCLTDRLSATSRKTSRPTATPWGKMCYYSWYSIKEPSVQMMSPSMMLTEAGRRQQRHKASGQLTHKDDLYWLRHIRNILDYIVDPQRLLIYLHFHYAVLHIIFIILTLLSL